MIVLTVWSSIVHAPLCHYTIRASFSSVTETWRSETREYM